jgi:glycosyltransferase involved in cell wall biosynthesis
MASPVLTVAIRTYNRASNIAPILDALNTQTVADLPWEIVIVDNNSSDNTAQVIHNYKSKIPLRYIHEPIQGAAIARRRAIKEAHSDLIAFLDDDNIPIHTWVQAIHNFSLSHPQAVAWGGINRPRFQTLPPEGFHHLHLYFALIDRGPNPLRYDPKRRIVPPGAGLVIRRPAWLAAVPDRMMLLGPTGQGIPTKGEDLEALFHMSKAGGEIWYNPSMVLEHLIESDRLTPDYLLNFCRTIGLSSHPLRMIPLKSWQRPIATLAFLLSDLRHLILASRSPDLIPSCQRELILARLQSPFRDFRPKSLSVPKPALQP